MTDTPVSTGSRGRIAPDRVERIPGDRRAVDSGHRRAVVDRLAAAIAHSAQPAVANGYAERLATELHTGARLLIPAVPSSTWITATSRSTSNTWPWRTVSSASVIVTNSSQPTPLTPETTTRGPRSSRTAV